MASSYPSPMQTVNVCYQYEDAKRPAVDHVSLTVEKGSFVAVLGHNGSGKSTLAKLMNALFLPTEGKVLVCGLDTSAEEEIWNVRRHAGMVFQNPDNQIVANMVREDVAFGLENLGVPHDEMLPRIDAALAAVRMTEFAAHAPHMLSGGQKQRVAVAGVLAMQPEVMILDEATAMLDPSGRKEIFEIVRRLNREEGVTVIWITHFMEEAVQADYIYIMDDGQTVARGTAKEIFADSAALHGYGLDVPVAAEFSEALRGLGVDMPEGILTADEAVEALCR